MNVYSLVVQKLERVLGKYRLDRKIKNKLSSTVLESDTSHKIVIVSLVYHNAVNMTIAALRTFVRQFPFGRIELIDDGSLTTDDYKTFMGLFSNIKIIHIKEIDTGNCPSGNCWERLIHIVDLSQENYVIQVDTDTLTLGALSEVWQNYSNNVAFSVGEPEWPEPIDLEYISMIAGNKRNNHVQTLSEASLNKLNIEKLKTYIRGCAAFAGFPRNTITRQDLEEFSSKMENLIGLEKWSEWGSEQFASNVMISICDKANILSWPRYQNFGFPFINSYKSLNSYHGKVSLIHFIGPHRFDNSIYNKLIDNLDKL